RVAVPATANSMRFALRSLYLLLTPAAMPYSPRPAVPADAETIAQYNAAMALETEGKSLDLDVLTAGVRAVFADASRGRYFVVDDAEHGVVGCLMVTYEWSDWRNGVFWWIQSVYVHPDHRRRGVFGMLYDAVREAGHAEPDVIGYRLYVEDANDTAQRTYTARGMNPAGYQVYEALRFEPSKTPDK
ncbi:MAG: GNAT family N-acetyltransferase, partial [Planctomycetota bacterium]